MRHTEFEVHPSYLLLNEVDLTQIGDERQQDLMRSVLRTLMFEILDENPVGSIDKYEKLINEVNFLSSFDELFKWGEEVLKKPIPWYRKMTHRLGDYGTLAESCALSDSDGEQHYAVAFIHKSQVNRKRQMRIIIHELDHTSRRIMGIEPPGNNNVQDADGRWIGMGFLMTFGQIIVDQVAKENPNLPMAHDFLNWCSYACFAMVIPSYIRYLNAPIEKLANQTAKRIIP